MGKKVGEQKGIAEAVKKFNATVGARLGYNLAVVSPKGLRPADKNARFMRPEVMARLIRNVERDGSLQSVPLCFMDGDDNATAKNGVYSTIS